MSYININEQDKLKSARFTLLTDRFITYWLVSFFKFTILLPPPSHTETLMFLFAYSAEKLGMLILIWQKANLPVFLWAEAVKPSLIFSRREENAAAVATTLPTP